MGEDGVVLYSAMIAAVATIVTSLLAVAASRIAAVRERRRVLYGEAVQAALAWQELLYRVRRRRDNGAAVKDVVDHFHDAQDRLTYYQGWVGSDSKFLARSYRVLVFRIKRETQPLIQNAWQQPVREVETLGTSPDEAHPVIEEALQAFLLDARAHLSLQPWRKFGVWWRNRLSRHELVFSSVKESDDDA